MKSFFAYVKKLFTICLYPWGRGKESERGQGKAKQSSQVKGTTGIVKPDAMFVRHDGKNVLVVMMDFGDVPTWVEYDSTLSQFSIVQSSGSVAYLDLFLHNEDRDAVKQLSRIMLVTQVEKRRVLHHLQFVAR